MQKPRALIAIAALAAFASAQAPVTLQHSWKQGEVGKYKFTGTAKGKTPQSVTITFTESVDKVYPNGDADVTVEPTSFTGTDAPAGRTPPTPPPVTRHLDKQGVPSKGEDPTHKDLDFLWLSTILPAGSVTPGQVVKVDLVNPADSDKHITGTLKVLSIEGGIAKLESKLTWPDSPNAGKSVKIHSTYSYDAGNDRLVSMDTALTGDVGDENAPSEIDFKLVRQ